jgi:glucokinase
VERLVIGADVGGTRVKFLVGKLTGAIVAQGDIPTEPNDAAATLERLAAAVRNELGDRARSLAGIGLACAGIVSPADGRLGRSPNLPGWENSDLGRMLEELSGGVPVLLVNDVNAALYGEYRFGAGRGARDVVMIALGTGVGGGVLLDGRLHLGANDSAGEIGHMVLDPDGPRCACGNAGCLEAYAGSTGLLKRAGEVARSDGASAAQRALFTSKGTPLTTEALHALAEQGDETARSLFAEAGTRLGQAIANVANLLDPERVIVGGGVAQAGDWLLEPCRKQVRRLVLAEAAKGLPIVRAELGPHAAARGAAALAAEREI